MTKQFRIGTQGSAKTGDEINQIFFRVAADLAGVKVSKAQIEAQQIYKPIQKTHDQNDKQAK